MDPSFDSLLEDDTFQPLKRNHACLQCKKRKVKCDATRPTCAPCMRSHAHAIRAAQRNKTAPPIITCTYADVDSPEVSQSPPVMEVYSRRDSGSIPDGEIARKKTSGKRIGDKDYRREKDIRREEDREQLLARIAELERKLAGMTPSDSGASSSRAAEPVAQTNASVWINDIGDPGAANANNGGGGATIQGISNPTWVPDAAGQSGTTAEWDFGELFMVPMDWPKNLPSPILLEHLIDTFFTHAPQLPRILHRGRLMTRLRLPPSHPDFPHASLLHAICAAASAHTAWVNNLPPELLENTILRHKQMNVDMENIEDFALAQAASAQRAIRTAVTICLFGPGRLIFEILQATVILSDIYFAKGLPLEGWLIAGHPARLMKALELSNKNQPKRYKEQVYPEPADDIDREERLATIWMAFVLDSGFSVNSYWSQSFDLHEMRCALPTSLTEFNRKDGLMLANPQTAESPDLMFNHPVADSFVLTIKASILISRAARWLRDWQQRDIVPGDELDGLKSREYQLLITDMYSFQSTIPIALKNVFRIVDQTPSGHPGFDANLLMVHILPNVALCLMHEPFVDWRAAINSPLALVQKSYEAIIGVLHLIPSNLDVSLVFTTLLCFSLYTAGRIIANFVQRAIEMQQFGLAVRYRADLATVQNLLDRYGMKQSLGQMMSTFLEQYLRVNGGEQLTLGDAKIRDSSNNEPASNSRQTSKLKNRPGSSSSNPTPPMTGDWGSTSSIDPSAATGPPENQVPVPSGFGGRVLPKLSPLSSGDDSSKTSPASWAFGLEGPLSTEAGPKGSTGDKEAHRQAFMDTIKAGEGDWGMADAGQAGSIPVTNELHLLGRQNIQGLSVKDFAGSSVALRQGEERILEVGEEAARYTGWEMR